MVTTIGFPKAGNHALVKACLLLGMPCDICHDEYREGIAGPVVYTKRDPRNIVCSWLRFNNKPVTPGMFLSSFRKFQTRSLVEEMAAHEGWLTSGALIVRYEDLVASDAVMREIAQYVGVPYLEGAWEALPGMTRSWREPHANFHEIWTPEVDAAWNAEGGPELLARWGYSNG